MFMSQARMVLPILLAAAAAAPAADKPRTDRYGDPLPAGALARLGTMRLRHVYAAVIFTPDGKQLISAGADGMLRYWDAATGKEKRRLRLQVGDSAEAASGFQLYRFAADGRSVAGYARQLIHIWDTATGKELKRFPLGKDFPIGVYRLALSRDGTMLAADLHGGNGHDLRTWSVTTGKQLFTRKMPEYCNSLAFSPDGKLLGTVGNNQGLHLWDTATGSEIRKIAAARSWLAFAPDGIRVAATTRMGGVKGWNLSDGTECFDIPPMPGVFMGFLTFAPDDKTLAIHTYRQGGEELFWDIAAGKQLHAIPVQSAQMVFSPDSKIAAFHGTAIRLFDVATGKEINPRASHTGPVSSLTVAPDGSIATTSMSDGAVRLWDAASGKSLRAIPAHTFYVRSSAFTPDSRFLVTGGGDNLLRLWDRQTGKEVRHFTIESADPKRDILQVFTLALSSDGKRLVSLAGGGDLFSPRQLLLWDTATGKRLQRRTPAQSPGVFRAYFSPDAQSMAIQRGADFVVEDVMTGREIVKIAGREPLAFSPDGQILALADVKPKSPPPGTAAERPGEVSAICLVELTTGKRLLRIDTGPVSHNLLAYSPDGRTLAIANRDGFRIWDAATGRELYHGDLPEQYRGPGNFLSFVTALAYLPSGDRLATGLMNSTTLIWDLQPKSWRAGIALKNMKRGDLERLWSDLAGDDAAKAHQAVWTLAAVPDKAVPFLKDHLHPTAALDAKQVQSLIADLDSPEFSVREQVGKKLASFGEHAEPALRQALAGNPSLEARRRLEALLADTEKTKRGMVRSAELLRTMRAIRVLERIGNLDSRQLLRTLASGGPGARQTRLASETLHRLEQRADIQGMLPPILGDGP